VDQTSEPSLGTALDAIWAKFLPETMDRVAILEAAAQALPANRLSPQQREEAHSTAHKLAGVLGSFGLARGTELARELEMAFAQESGQDPLPGEHLARIASELRTIIASRK
jgi:HPt (histidine-containing phosphotransfer) domain-containing protein